MNKKILMIIPIVLLGYLIYGSFDSKQEINIPAPIINRVPDSDNVVVSLNKIDNKDLSTRFQFEDRIGIGLKNRNLNFYLRFMHYSNAGIKEPNDGLNSTMVGFSYRF